MVGLPNASIAAATAACASYNAEVVTSRWAMSDCSWASVAPYSAAPKPPNKTRPSATVISWQRRSPWETWWSLRVRSVFHTSDTGVWAAHSSSGMP